jgi:hypothetical protein
MTINFGPFVKLYQMVLEIMSIYFVSIQSDQKENKSEQALQIIGRNSMQIGVQCMGVDNLWSQTLLYNKSYLMNF